MPRIELVNGERLMVILEAVRITLQLSDFDSWIDHPIIARKRSKGVHLSGVLKVMAKELGVMKEMERADFEDEFPLRMFIGQSLERQTAGLYPSLVWQPGEVKRDGIVGSPDGHLWDAIHEGVSPRILRKKRIWEHKYTHKSCRNFDLGHIKNQLWIWQLMGYCSMDRGRPNEAELHVVFGNGNYDRPFSEEYWKFVIRFVEAELNEFWALVLRFRDKAIPE